MPLHVYKDADALNEALAGKIAMNVEKTLSVQDRFTWLLSGGNTPRNLYRLMATDPYRSQIDWTNVHIFFGDERVVPFEDERNNGRMAKESLLDHVPIPREQIHYIQTEKEVGLAVSNYEKLLHQYFEGKNTSFDLSLLGMGDDAHTLSFFPHSPFIHEKNKWVVSLYLPEQKMYRISLTPAVVNKSSEIFFLTTGSSKAHALKNVLRGPFQPELYPAQLIRSENNPLQWYLDEAAGKEL